MAQILKMFQLADDYRVAEVNIGSGRVHTELGAKGFASLARFFELCTELFLADDLEHAFFQIGELFVNGPEFRLRHGDRSTRRPAMW